MSSLLEKAIVDATALKEAALKNAENMVIEKYSQEIKDAMESLLEQDEGIPSLGSEDPTAAADPFADMMSSDQAFGETGAEGETEDPEAPGAEGNEIPPDSIQSNLPDSWRINDEQEELIRIRLDALEAEFEDENEEDGVFGGDDNLDPDEVSISIDDLDAEHGTDAVTAAPETPAAPATPDISAPVQAALQEVLDELSPDDEVDVDELLEALKVDFEPQKSGWAGTPESIMREYEQMLLAREQDDKVKEENEALRKKVAELQKENKTIGSATLKLQNQNERYRVAFDALQEKLEQVNVSNAKLLYINQALENASLNERQKRKVVEAISKAGSINEAKVVYETLQNAVGSANFISNNAPSSINEAVTRKSSLIMAARQEQKVDEADPFLNRMQRLAGIKT